MVLLDVVIPNSFLLENLAYYEVGAFKERSPTMFCTLDKTENLTNLFISGHLLADDSKSEQHNMDELTYPATLYQRMSL